MKIKKIQKQKSQKYKILLENGEAIITYDDVIINNGLLFNKELDNELLQKINNETIYYDIYNKTLKYIEKKLRSEKEIRKYLEKYDIGYEEKIIEQLKNIKLINDNNYVKAYISDKIYLSTDGPNKIKKDLLNQGIEEYIIDEYLKNIEDEIVINKCEKLIDKKIKSNKKNSIYILKQKIISDMLEKGFELNIIKSILENKEILDNNAIEKEYNKLYSKLIKKYSDKELYFQMKSKLYQKGFKNEEIDEYINKTVDFYCYFYLLI